MSAAVAHAMTNYESITGEDDILGGGGFGVVHKIRRKRDLKVNTLLALDIDMLRLLPIDLCMQNYRLRWKAQDRRTCKTRV